MAIVLNGDVYADLGWFIPFLEAAATEEFEALLAVDPTSHPPAEAMKVALERDDGSRPRVTRISKTGIDRAQGEYVGLAALGPATSKSLLGVLRRFRDDSTRADEWYEAKFQLAIEDGARFEAWEVPHRNWVEIDTPRDLRDARRMRLQPLLDRSMRTIALPRVLRVGSDLIDKVAEILEVPNSHFIGCS